MDFHLTSAQLDIRKGAREFCAGNGWVGEYDKERREKRERKKEGGSFLSR
jgi:hypothetical protein